MAESLDYSQGEERRLGLSESTEKWAFVEDIKIKVESISTGAKRRGRSDLEQSDAHDRAHDRKRMRKA